MKPGDVVELKEGTLGLEGSDLFAIYLDRVKSGSNYNVVLHTVNGRKEIGKDRVHRTVFKRRVADPGQMSPGQLDARLSQLIDEAEGTSPEEQGERRHDLDKLDDRRLWELIVNDIDGPFTPEQATRLVTDGHTPEDVAEIRSVLQTCQAHGVGYFERVEGRGEQYKAYAVDEIKAVRREIEGLRAVRNKLIRIVEVEPDEDDDWDEPETVIEPVPPSEADLDEDDTRRLELIAEQMRDFVLHDTDRGQVGLADTPIHTLDGFILNRHCRFLAFDWLGGKQGSISGAYVRFLLDTGLTSVREANELVAERHINLSEHFSSTYPERALRAAERLPDGIPDDWREGRADLTHLETYTIDPPDAEDFDDAISLETDGDEHLLYVHIADVAQYVEQGSTIDWEARSRGTSVYLPTDVLPMLPPRLAEDLCSLRAGAPRPAMTVKLRIGPDGEVADSELMESIVEVDANKAYDEADEAIEAGEDPYASLHALAQTMRGARHGLELETDELRVHVDHESVDPHLKSGTQATKLIEQFMVAANEAVARFLTEHDVPCPYRCHPLPDRASAETFNKRMDAMEQPFEIELPEPDEDDEASEDEGEAFMEALEGGKVELVGGGFIAEEDEDHADAADDEAEGDDEPTIPAATMDGLADLDEEERLEWLTPFQEILGEVSSIEDDRLRELIHLKLLGCMGRALYTPANIGHFGLGSTCYLHFTSPIRRYPDLVTHRQIKWLIRDGDGTGRPAGGASDTSDTSDADTHEDEPPHTEEELVDLCPKNTDQSVEAEQLERDLIAVAMAFDALGEHWSGTQPGLVNGITKGGVFLSLPRGLEARLATSDIPGGPWDVDEAGAKLFKGERDADEPDETMLDEILEHGWREVYDEDLDEMVHVRLRLGDEIPVRISQIDLAMGQVAVKLAGSGEARSTDGEDHDGQPVEDVASGEDSEDAGVEQDADPAADDDAAAA